MEVIIMVLSLMTDDGVVSHDGIRAFTTMDECELFIPAYQEFISMFNNPGNIVQSALRCHVVEIPTNVTGE